MKTYLKMFGAASVGYGFLKASMYFHSIWLLIPTGLAFSSIIPILLYDYLNNRWIKTKKTLKVIDKEINEPIFPKIDYSKHRRQSRSR